MKLTKLRAQTYGPIKDIELDLDYTGVTFIFGMNKDSSETGVTNAAGKSLLIGALPEIAYDHHPGEQGRTAVKSKDKTVLSFTCVNDAGVTYEYQKHLAPKKEFVILKDGKNTKSRGLDYGHEKVKAILGNEEEFFTRVYIDGTQPHPLIRGKAADQQAFFVNLCKLQDVDATRKLLTNELREVQKAAASYREVRTMFDDLKAKTIKGEELVALKIRLAEAEADHATLMERFQRDQKLRDLVAFEEDNKEIIEGVKALTKLSVFEETYDAYKSRRARLKEKRESALAWSAYKERLKQVKADREPKLKELMELVNTDDQDKIRERSNEYSDARERVTVLTADIQRLTSALVEVDELLEEPKYTADHCSGKVEIIRQQLEHAREFKNGKCPTCGSEVDAHDPEVLKVDLQKWKTRLAKAKEYSAQQEILSVNRETKTSLKLKNKQLEVAQAEKAKLAKWHKAYTLVNQIPDLPVAPDNVVKADIEAIDAKLEETGAALQLFRAAAPVIEKIRQTETLDPIKRAKAKSKIDVGGKLSALNAEIAEASAKITVQTENLKQMKTLRTRGLVLKKQADDEPVLKALIKAYSKTGYKKLRIQQYAAVFQEQINKFASVFFTEETTFELTYDTKLVFSALRKKGKVVKKIPVARLSGTERALLTMIVVAASLSLQPKKERLNVLFLDEPDAHMGYKARDHFLRGLSLLNKVIPHIIVVTPKSDVHMEGSRSFTVVKERGVSKLVPGRVQ